MDTLSLASYLDSAVRDAGLRRVLLSVAVAGGVISDRLKTADTGKIGTKNIYGEEQVALDVLSNEIMMNELRLCGEVGVFASEELPDEVSFGDGRFALATDPLDGSSLVDVNLSVGTIFSIYETDHFIGLRGDDQVAAGFMLYGPRTTMMLTLRDGVREFLLDPVSGGFYQSRENISIEDRGKMFAPGNLRAARYRNDYVELMNYWMREQYTLRYSGGMVPDVNQILCKGKGVFTYPGYVDAPDGKLRLLVECNAMALLVEQAGGAATDGKVRILEKKISNLSQRTPIYIGSKSEVVKVEEYLE